MTAPQSPWVALILHFHYPHYDHLQAIHHTIHSASPFWKGAQKTSNIFLLGLGYICGEGNHICFWLDHRFGALPLAQQYQNLFRLVADQNSSIASNRYNTEWAPCFKIFLSHESMLQLASLLQDLHHANISPRPDQPTWNLHNSSQFTVNSIYKFIASPPAPLSPFIVIWSFKVALKVRINMWLAAQDCLLTPDILHHRHTADSLLCPFCNNVIESANHIFMLCSDIAPITNQLNLLPSVAAT